MDIEAQQAVMDAYVAMKLERDRLREALEGIRALPSQHDLFFNAEARAMYEIAIRALGPKEGG